MIKNIDRKIGYWTIIAIPIAISCVGFLALGLIECLYLIPAIFGLYLYNSLHRCPECNKFILSWSRKCRKCDNPNQYYKVEANTHDI